MNFPSIIYKNFKYNFSKYLSIYFVNTLIVAMLFMYGSLMYNSKILNEMANTSIYDTTCMSLVGMILFSIVFITYSNISFLKYRGKEFGMYFTLGMTTKDLIKLLFIENLVVLLISIISGIISGGVFGKLFYMILNKVLIVNSIPFELNIKSFLLSIGVFLIIFSCNFIFNIIYLRKVSIIDVLKSSSKKEVGKGQLTLGVICIIIFTVVSIGLPIILRGEDGFFAQSKYVVASVLIMLVCLYMVIGLIISIASIILKRFKRIYNNNLLVLSNLSHRFLGYKNTLYIVSLLMTGAVFFIGYSYSLYTSSEDIVKDDYPYNIMFVESNDLNKIKEKKVKDVLEKNKSKIEKYSIVEYLELGTLGVTSEYATLIWDKASLISESNYNNHMGTNYDLGENESIFVDINDYNLFVDIDNPYYKAGFYQIVLGQINNDDILALENDELSGKDLINSIDDNKSLKLDKKNIKSVKKSFTNGVSTNEYSSGEAFIVDDKIYESLKNNISVDKIKKLHLIDGDISESSFKALLSELKEINNMDNTYWNEEIGSYENMDKNIYRPIYRQELLNVSLEENGMIFFTMIFIGILFTVSSVVVLYYKVLSDIEDEKERIVSLNRIGILSKEVNHMISKELAITFFAPTLIGLFLANYYLYIMYINTGMLKILLISCLKVSFAFFIIQLILYFICRRKYLYEIEK